MSEIVLKVDGLSKSYDLESPVVQNVSFEVKKGQVITLFGESGCGKSTLLKMISGHLEPDTGRVIINDKKLPYPSEILIPGNANIELVKQDYDLFPNHKVDEVLYYKLRKYVDEYVEERTVELLDACGLLPYRYRIVKTLSGGQQQRLAFAQALADEPDVILLDEPFNSLDSSKRRGLRSLVKKVVETYQLSVVMVTHDIEDVFSLSDDLIIMKEGKVARRGTVNELYYQPKSYFVTELLGEINYIDSNKKTAIRPEDMNLELGGKAKIVEQSFTGTYYRLEVVEKEKSWIVYNTNQLDLYQDYLIVFNETKLILY